MIYVMAVCGAIFICASYFAHFETKDWDMTVFYGVLAVICFIIAWVLL
jgi:hypothetical protein